MDSLTQIVLGAACGEAVLGRKIGNKALLFGAIGGTIPDLDVFVGNLLYKNHIDAMLFHRGFMHSLLFAIIASLLLGWLVYRLYDKGRRLGTTTLRDWILLFFWSLFTHPILDCFTPYGTQLFSPFSNYRVAFNNIAVADPLYTLPFLFCMIVLLFFNRKSAKRQYWLKLALGISSLYMVLTIVNRWHVGHIFERSLKAQGIAAKRFSLQPTIFNNVLWYGIAETDTTYHVAFYSLLDTSHQFSEWKTLPKQRDLRPEQHDDIKNLAWFSNGYFNVEVVDNETYLYKDLRYPLVKTPKGYRSVFNLKLYKTHDRLDMKPFAPEMDDFKFSMKALWKRLKGH